MARVKTRQTPGIIKFVKSLSLKYKGKLLSFELFCEKFTEIREIFEFEIQK